MFQVQSKIKDLKVTVVSLQPFLLLNKTTKLSIRILLADSVLSKYLIA